VESTTCDFAARCEQARQALLSYAYMCCGDLDLAEDIVQETLLIAFQKQDHYFPHADFMSWLVSIARHVWLREKEKRKINSRARKYLEQNATLFFEEAQYEKEELDCERVALTKCLKKLPDADRSLIAAHFDQQKKYQAIAESMGKSLSWVKVRMFRARAALLKCVRLTLAEAKRGAE
jgi:RNA polymerase sigma-70 factor (ECF subfamily)